MIRVWPSTSELSGPQEVSHQWCTAHKACGHHPGFSQAHRHATAAIFLGPSKHLQAVHPWDSKDSPSPDQWAPRWQDGWFSWDEEQQAAFWTDKEVTCTITRLVHPHPTTAISLAIDASNTTWGLSYSSGHNEAGSPLLLFNQEAGPHTTEVFRLRLTVARNLPSHQAFLFPPGAAKF
jgi:hypothetical protein